jgi:3-methyladenine DNA glycosylase AlkD
VTRSTSQVARAARDARRQLAALARPADGFDASRYFRGTDDLAFYNVGTTAMRGIARAIYEAQRRHWTIDDAMAFADALMPDAHLEAKGVGIDVVARFRRDFTPALLPRWKRWLAKDLSANWATTDAICGALIGPLLVRQPQLAGAMATWAAHRNLWVRRAALVGLIPLARRGQALDLVYAIARRLHADRADLIQKAAGWALREAGKTDPARLERYLIKYGPAIPRTTLRYAIERFPPAKRKMLLAATRGVD